MSCVGGWVEIESILCLQEEGVSGSSKFGPASGVFFRYALMHSAAALSFFIGVPNILSLSSTVTSDTTYVTTTAISLTYTSITINGSRFPQLTQIMDSNDIIAVHFVFVSIGFSQAEVMRGVSVCAVDRQCGVLSVLPPTLYTRSRRVEVLSPTLLFLPSYSQPQPQLSNTHPPLSLL